MATLVLSALGAAAGASLGGGLLGLSSVVIGRAIGAVAGRAVDQMILGAGSEPVEHGKVDRFRLTGASEGAAVTRLFGRMRLGGQVIWASEVQEHVASTGSGKGMLNGPKNREFSYSVSLAVALCEGEITRVGRVWADGQEIAAGSLTMRVYPGSEDQLPDPRIEAVEGAGMVPAYRGIAYVVIEDLDLTAYGNRVPVLNFEVFRPEQPGEAEVARGVRAVAMVPGTGEYALATTSVHYGARLGEAVPVNENTPLGMTDFSASLTMLDEELPGCEATSLVVSWFGSDLRCGACEVAPKVEKHDQEGQEMPWRAGGVTRGQAGLVPRDQGRPVYGGTPADGSVIEAITALRGAGKAVTFYPFVLMDQGVGNGLPDPWTGSDDQPVLPWRGRITLSLAPGQDGSPDGSAAAEAEVAAFFGTAQAGDFSVSGGKVSYTGPNEWSYRRFILHYAHLCALAGGVDAFLIGSEMRGLTQIRGAGGSFPAVAAMRQLAADVRGILGAGVKLSYAADWTEYFGYHPQDGSGDVYFHLDPLWADANIDFIGIDNYMPLADWLAENEHLDGQNAEIWHENYLKSNILGGEGYDWFYHAPEARAAQIRTPITDGAHGEPWVFRFKDIPNWWQNAHHERIGGVRQASPTDWVPGSKPVWFTELGCAAVDKGPNQPNRFLDAKSDESGLPRHSDGRRDDFIQMQYLRAMLGFWADSANNPTDETSGVTMLDMSRAHVWAWDARPFPWFPGDRDLWSDGENYARGHWLNGRTGNRSLASVVREICARAGVDAVDVSGLAGLVRGYALDQTASARSALQPLMLAYGIEAVERGGVLRFFSRSGRTDREIAGEALAITTEIGGALELVRAPEAEIAGRVRLSFTEADGGYETRAAEAVFAGDDSDAVAASDLPLVLTQGEGRAICERWLAEARVARDAARFALPPSGLGTGAGDVVRLDTPGGAASFRIDHVEEAGVQIARAVRVEPGLYVPSDTLDLGVRPRRHVPPVPVLPLFLDLPLIGGDEVPHAPHLAVTARPWPGSVAVYGAAADHGYALDRVVTAPAVVGETETPLARARAGVIDRGPALRVRLTSGTLSSAPLAAVMNGANLAAIGDGSNGNWELFQFTGADLVAPDTWEITGRLRGQAGSDALMPEVWPAGSVVVVIDAQVGQIDLPSSARGLERHFRIGPALRPIDDATYRHEVRAFAGIGLRPLAPVHLRAAEAGGNLALSWVRRTRIDGDTWQAVEVPLGEEAESYLVRVAAGGATLREVGVTAPGWTYTAAMRAADGPAEAVGVAQVSARFGPGPFRWLGL